MLQFAVGLYLGIGTGHAVSVLAEIGFGRGVALIWRVPLLILFWPGLYVAALAQS
jgi:hypothetical protein